VRLPDQSSAARTWSEAFSTDAIDNASRCVSDTFQVLKLNRLPARRLRWVYDSAVVLCAHREDGISLTLFTGRDDQAVDHAGVARWIEQFQSGAIG